MDDNNMDTQTAPEAEKQTQGLMGGIPSNEEPMADVAETSVPHLVQNEEVGSDEDALFEKPEWFPDKHWDEKEGPDLEGLVKSNLELEKAFHRGDHKVPEEYKLDVLNEFEVPADDELLSGFVTWAKHCLKYENNNLCLLESTDTGVSVPIEPVGSIPDFIMGLMKKLISSLVYPKAN